MEDSTSLIKSVEFLVEEVGKVTNFGDIMCEKLENHTCKGVEWGDICLDCECRDTVNRVIILCQKEFLRQKAVRQLDKKSLESFNR